LLVVTVNRFITMSGISNITNTVIPDEETRQCWSIKKKKKPLVKSFVVFHNS